MDIEDCRTNTNAIFRNPRPSNPENDYVEVEWDVRYVEITHDIVISARVQVVRPGTSILQVWLEDRDSSIAIPQLIRWVGGVAEFSKDQRVQTAKVGLFDSKWDQKDAGARYFADLWGFLESPQGVVGFSFRREFEYPK
jgi:hypothetical protein